MHRLYVVIFGRAVDRGLPPEPHLPGRTCRTITGGCTHAIIGRRLISGRTLIAGRALYTCVDLLLGIADKAIRIVSGGTLGSGTNISIGSGNGNGSGSRSGINTKFSPACPSPPGPGNAHLDLNRPTPAVA